MIHIKHKLFLATYKFDLLWVFLAFLPILIKVFFFTDLSYKSGLAGNPFYFIGRFMFGGLLLGGLFLSLILIVLINIIWSIIKSYRTKKVNWLKLSLSIFPLLILLPPAFYWSSVSEPGAVPFLRGYEKWVQKEVNIPAIQEWLASLPSEHSGKYYFEAKDFPGKLPEVITKLNLYHIYFSEFKDGQRQVEFEWGSAFGHWGIRIGLPGMDCPEEGCIKLSESEWEYRRPIQSGVYIFDRG
jgi:hypothetical protein